jgi:hypothetical protein
LEKTIIHVRLEDVEDAWGKRVRKQQEAEKNCVTRIAMICATLRILFLFVFGATAPSGQGLPHSLGF